MLQRETGMDTGYRPSIAAGIRPMYLRARDRGYSRGYGWHAEVRKILVIQTVSVCYSTPAGGARPLVVYSDEIGDDLYRRNNLSPMNQEGHGVRRRSPRVQRRSSPRPPSCASKSPHPGTRTRTRPRSHGRAQLSMCR